MVYLIYLSQNNGKIRKSTNYTTLAVLNLWQGILGYVVHYLKLGWILYQAPSSNPLFTDEWKPGPKPATATQPRKVG